MHNYCHIDIMQAQHPMPNFTLTTLEEAANQSLAAQKTLVGRQQTMQGTAGTTTREKAMGQRQRRGPEGPGGGGPQPEHSCAEA